MSIRQVKRSLPGFLGKTNIRCRFCPPGKRKTGELDCPHCYGHRWIRLYIEQRGDETLYALKGLLYHVTGLEPDEFSGDWILGIMWYGYLTDKEKGNDKGRVVRASREV